jgi:hypothetical protein
VHCFADSWPNMISLGNHRPGWPQQAGKRAI